MSWASLDFGNETRLHDAIAASLDTLLGIEGRKVILVLTDGDDSASGIGWKDVLARAVAEEVMIYTIGLEVEYLNRRTRPDRSLRKLAEETGGGYFELRETRRARLHLHTGLAGITQPVRPRVCTFST